MNTLFRNYVTCKLFNHQNILYKYFINIGTYNILANINVDKYLIPVSYTCARIKG